MKLRLRVAYARALVWVLKVLVAHIGRVNDANIAEALASATIIRARRLTSEETSRVRGGAVR